MDLSRQGMETFVARLASFEMAKPTGKKRASNAKASKEAAWPHETPLPDQLALAGFYFQPTASAPDNVVCFHCHKGLDGWEKDDNPIREHMAYSPECAWAIQVGIELDTENGTRANEDPMSDRLVEARKATFGSLWPHESKRGWGCKVQKMAEAGWYYCPTPESDDFVRCAYCNLSLDGWEPKDKPYDEHQRRSAGCAFFCLAQDSKLKSTRSKKGRGSKASRTSLQSNATAIVEDYTVHETSLDEDLSILSAATDMTTVSTATAATKKSSRPKKGKAKVASKATKTKPEEAPPAKSIAEPDADGSEAKAGEAATKATGDRKRTSDAMQVDAEPAPPRKRRNTRKQDSILQPLPTSQPMQPTPDGTDVSLTDAELMPPPSMPTSKKGGKGGRNRSSSTARKASCRSTASRAPRKAPLSDDAIDAAIEADLDRPLTDDEDMPDVVAEVEKPRTRRLTRTRPAPRSRAASTAGTKRPTEASSMPAQELPVQVVIDVSAQVNVLETAPVVTEEDTTTLEKVVAGQEVDHDSDANAVEPTQPKRGGRKAGPASKKQKETKLPTTNSDRNTKESVARSSPEIPQVHAQLPPVEKDISSSFEDAPEGDPEDVKPPTAAEHASERGATPVIPSIEKTAAELTKTKAARGRPKSKKLSAPPPEPEVAAPPARSEPQRPTTPIANIRPSMELLLEAERELAVYSEAPAPRTMLPPPMTPVRQIPSPTPSPQSSNAENQPPSSRPSRARPPLGSLSPTQPLVGTARVPPAASTPTRSPSRLNHPSGGGGSRPTLLQSTFPWAAVDLETVFLRSPGAEREKENIFGTAAAAAAAAAGSSAPDGAAGVVLSSPERKMTVEEWVMWNAERGEESLRRECERVVSAFEQQGVRALRALEGIVVAGRR